jgi:hypothetical protein
MLKQGLSSYINHIQEIKEEHIKLYKHIDLQILTNIDVRSIDDYY